MGQQVDHFSLFFLIISFVDAVHKLSYFLSHMAMGE
jgi:hypothetical protein